MHRRYQTTYSPKPCDRNSLSEVQCPAPFLAFGLSIVSGMLVKDVLFEPLVKSGAA